jgi:bacteriorhodopsin
MEVAQPFLPTAGVVGFLPVVTYFFLVVALFAFLGNFVFTLATLPGVQSEHRIAHTLTAVVAAIAALSYYLIQVYYRDMLAELATVTDVNDRQTLIRESYNALGQYRYMDWFIAAPLLLLQIVFRLNLRLSAVKRPLAALLLAGLFMFFASYIGHQQLSFDNEIQVGRKVTWGLIATIDFVFILFTLNQLWKQFGEQTNPANQRAYRLIALTTTVGWGVYLIGYFLTVTPIDFNWIHLVFTIADLISKIGVGILVYFASTNSSERS